MNSHFAYNVTPSGSNRSGISGVFPIRDSTGWARARAGGLRREDGAEPREAMRDSSSAAERREPIPIHTPETFFKLIQRTNRSGGVLR
jgi:hypothetical protein